MLEGQKEEQLMAGVVLWGLHWASAVFSEEPQNQVSERENKQVRCLGIGGCFANILSAVFFFNSLSFPGTSPWYYHLCGFTSSLLTNDIQIDWAPLSGRNVPETSTQASMRTFNQKEPRSSQGWNQNETHCVLSQHCPMSHSSHNELCF